MSYISETVSFIANLCTISAFVVALWLWFTWKKQQNYSFSRDKIFEAEIAVSKLHTAHISYIHEYYEYQLKGLKSSEVIDPTFYQAKFRDAKNNIDKYSNEYDIALHSLLVLEIDYSKDAIKSFIISDNLYAKYFNRLSECQDTESLEELFWNSILIEMQDLRKNAISNLSSIRNNL